jgi:hypothetical protein
MLHKINNNDYFYHIPKTGGRAFRTYNTKFKPGDHKIITKEEAKGKNILIIFRCPVDRFLSAYYFTLECSKIKGNVHYNSPRIKKLRDGKFFKTSPLEMLEHLQTKGNNIDDANLFHFNSMYSWCKNIPKSSIELLPFGEIKNKESISRFKSSRNSINEEDDIEEITSLVKKLNPIDYEHFSDIVGYEEAQQEWL